jgi:lipopolysaccharide export system protein LptA
MKISLYVRVSTALAIAAVVCGAGVLAVAQPRRNAAKPRGRRAPQQAQPEAVHFGDLTIDKFRNITFDLPAGVVTVTGPNTVVDSVDPKQPKATNRLQSSQIVVHLVAGSRSEVERVEAGGGVKFSSTRPAGKDAVTTFNGTGSRGTYFKKEGRLKLDGPVSFAGAQPTADKKSEQSVSGTAGEATYDENKEELILSGGVKAKVFAPESLSGPAPFTCDTFRIELATRPYRFFLNNNDPDTGRIQIRPKEQPKDKPKEEKKSP